MFIVWRGRGFLVPLISFGSLLATEFAVNSYNHDPSYYSQKGWPKLAAFVMAAVIVWRFGPQSEDDSPAIQPDVRRHPILRGHDTFFFVSVRHWPLILTALGMVFYFVPG